jgi:hypothetical protein
MLTLTSYQNFRQNLAFIHESKEVLSFLQLKLAKHSASVLTWFDFKVCNSTIATMSSFDTFERE